MFKTKVWAFLFLMTTCALSNSFADWSDDIYDHADHFPMQLQGMFATTLVGTCMEPDIKYKRMNGQVEKVSIQNSFLETGKIDIRVGTPYKEDVKSVMNSPIVFIIPGAFNNLDDSQARYLMSLLLKKGYVTITVPNPWGTDFISHGVKKPTGTVSYEGDVIYETFKNSYAYLKRLGFKGDDVRVLGVSYGSFLAAMVAAKNSEEENPVNIVDSTILSPPYQLGETISRLDHWVSESRPFINNSLLRALYKLITFCREANISNDSEFEENKAMSLVIGAGFHRELLRSVMLYDKMKNLNKIPGRKLGTFSRKHLLWRKYFTFDKYFETYAPEAKAEMMTEIGDLNYWTQKARDNGFDNFRILTSENDFLNEPVSNFAPNESTITLETGGHYGYRGMSWYKRLLDISY